ncbi:phosphogluconate dehydratase [Vibrio sp. S17_S38]|uniref:phosphogluconate dehydratase n=1 Tax=Vibrio sp. S17_S38 TaxID=2720229 RepID=UPI0016817D34|nr:phosphogluconate dehydratase [Vibrio sp. S17_S38]MBD1574242.1 phosphogluconate dehydratase [Vibrio sp. S17_S38]
MNNIILEVTNRILERSAVTRHKYLTQVQSYIKQGKGRKHLSCGNMAHTAAACGGTSSRLLDLTTMNVGIITAYNDMLSAHQPYQNYPDLLKQTLSNIGHSAQVAGGVPAMCDGVTQGQDGMDLSLFSRDLIAQATAIGLSHNTFDATLLLGVCDKIAPGQIIGALAFGHLPTAFVPSGPMSTGISNDEKVQVRQQYAAGNLGKDALQEMESSAYHSPGTCTFYGTANTNQLVFEAMGLMLPGSAFVPPTSPLRQHLTELTAKQIIRVSNSASQDFRPIGKVIDEKALVNGLVALLASGGSTNHTIHMIAIAKAAGFILTWDDFDALSDVVPQLTKMYPNGPADINAYEAAGGGPTFMRRLNQLGLLHMDATPIYGTMEDYLTRPELIDGGVRFTMANASADPAVIAMDDSVFSKQGGLKVLDGNIGRGVIKISAVAIENRYIKAPVQIFSSQHDVEKAYQLGELNRDVIIVVRHNGPGANGMPELHKLMPILGNLMKLGYKTALVTDGRLSGASGKVPAAIHITPESSKGGPLARLIDGDMMTLDAEKGALFTDAELEGRPLDLNLNTQDQLGMGRELFRLFRDNVSSAETGASIL